jgi:hypothetical protein
MNPRNVLQLSEIEQLLETEDWHFWFILELLLHGMHIAFQKIVPLISGFRIIMTDF